MLPILGAPIDLSGPPASSPPSSPIDAWNDSSPASSPNLGPSDTGDMDDEDDIEALDIEASPSSAVLARKNKTARQVQARTAHDLQASPAHPFSASTRAIKHPPQYEKRPAGSPKQKKTPQFRATSSFRKPINSLTRHDSGSSSGSFQDRFDLFVRPIVALRGQSMGLGRTSSFGTDGYIHDDAMGVYDTFSDDSGVSGLGDLRRIQRGLMEDPEEKLWAETIAQAVDGAQNIINLSDHGLTYIPPSIADLGNLVVLEGSKDPKERILSAQRSKSLSTSSVVFGSSMGIRSDEIQLFLAKNSISSLPNELFRLDTLVTLSLRANALTEIPPQIGQLKKLRELNIGNNQLKYLPAEILGLRLNNLTIDPNPFLPYPGTRTTPTTYKFEPRTIIPLSELCLRGLLSPCTDAQSDSTCPSTRSTSKTQKTWLSEKYDMPLSNEFLKNIPAPILEILSACAPDCVPSVLSPNVTPQASPMRKRRLAVARSQKRIPCVSTCTSPSHLLVGDYDAYRRPVFVSHAEERFTWEKNVAGQTVGGLYGVPILWRGCSYGCLDYLDPETVSKAEPKDEKDVFDAQFMEVDGGGAPFSSEGFEFDDD